MDIDIITVIKDLGVPVALVVYFLVKDWKFTQMITDSLARISEVLEDIEAYFKTASKGGTQ